MEHFVGRLQLRNLLLQSLDQHHQLVALSASDASRLAHSRSLKHLPPPTATPIRTSNPLINYLAIIIGVILNWRGTDPEFLFSNEIN